MPARVRPEARPARCRSTAGPGSQRSPSAESAPGDGLGHLVLGDDEPRRAARAAEQLDGLDAHPRVAAETAFLGRHGDGQLTGVREQREVGRVDTAGRVVGGGGVRGEDVAGDPVYGAHGGVAATAGSGAKRASTAAAAPVSTVGTLREHLRCGAAYGAVPPHPARQVWRLRSGCDGTAGM